MRKEEKNEEVKKLLEEGVKLLNEKKYEEAEKKFNKAKNKMPDLVEPYVGLGHVYAQKKEYKLAKENYEKAIEIEPSSEVYNNLGAIYFVEGNDEKAEECFNLAIALNEENVEAKKNMADLYYEQGKYKEAITLYEEAVVKTKEPILLLSIANCYFRLGDYEAAKYGYEKVIELDPNNKIAKENLEFVNKKINEKRE